jgi:hypothetical protein
MESSVLKKNFTMQLVYFVIIFQYYNGRVDKLTYMYLTL